MNFDHSPYFSQASELNSQGESLFRSQDYVHARRKFEEALRLVPGFQAALENLGRIFKIMGYEKKADFYFSQAAKSGSHSTSPRLNQGEVPTEEIEDILKKMKILKNSARENMNPGGRDSINTGHNVSCANINGKTNNGPPVSIITPLFNQAAFTKLLLEYLPDSCGRIPYELILVDNGSSDTTVKLMKSAGDSIRPIYNHENKGFARASNMGAEAAGGKYLLFLNNDIVPQKGWLSELISTLESDSSIGIVGSKLLYPDGTVQHAGVVFCATWYPYHLYHNCAGDAPYINKIREFSAVTGACMLIRRELFFQAGKFDEQYFNGLEDVDLCLMIKKMGKKIIYNPRSCLIHFSSRSAGRNDHMAQNQKYYESKWRRKVEIDDFRYLKEDKMALCIDPDSHEFTFVSEKVMEENVKDTDQRALPFLDANDLLGAHGVYADMVDRYPYYVHGLEKGREFAQKLGVQEVYRKCDERLKLLGGLSDLTV